MLLVGPHCEPAWWHDPAKLVTCWAGEESDPILPAYANGHRPCAIELWLESVFHPLDTHMAENPHAEFEPALAQLGSDVEVHVLPLRDADPAGAIVRSARELLPRCSRMTTRARTGVARAALGSVATQVVHDSPCPVLVVASLAEPRAKRNLWPLFLRSTRRRLDLVVRRGAVLGKEPAMKALVYHGPGRKAWEDVPKPTIVSDTDAIVRVDATTICGTDLHILKGDVPEVTDGRILGHEAVGTVEEVGTGVKNVQARRPRARVVHHRVRRVPLLSRGPLRPVPRRRRLDPRPPHRRHPGRVRARAVRRHLDVSGARPA